MHHLLGGIDPLQGPAILGHEIVDAHRQRDVEGNRDVDAAGGPAWYSLPPHRPGHREDRAEPGQNRAAASRWRHAEPRAPSPPGSPARRARRRSAPPPRRARAAEEKQDARDQQEEPLRLCKFEMFNECPHAGRCWWRRSSN